MTAASIHFMAFGEFLLVVAAFFVKVTGLAIDGVVCAWWM
jgi:hypothetical protein